MFLQATPIIGQTENNVKTTQKTLKVLPEVVIYDVTLTLTLPAQMTITSGMNAIAHAAEALYSPEANPVINLLAEQGVASIAKALPIIHKNPQDLEARSDALYGAWACGTWYVASSTRRTPINMMDPVAWAQWGCLCTISFAILLVRYSLSFTFTPHHTQNLP